MKAIDIFTTTMAMVDEMSDNGELDPSSTAEYKSKAPYILTLLQNEIIGIQNRYRKYEDYIYPVPIETLEQDVQLDDIEANTLLTNGLAAHLMINENRTLASFFQQRYEELKTVYLKPKPAKPEKREDVYDAGLNF